jgi:DEAD/DEAH box helicase domain-containing protein
VATATASGKSLVFQAAALRVVTENPEARVMVFYPLKALAADQMVSWTEVMTAAGFPATAVARIDGSTLADERLKAMETARIIVMTPDVCQAWMMRNISHPLIRRFVERLRILVLDEAHVLEAVFGSNVAFLLRRLQAARTLIAPGRRAVPLQFIAASATIANPADHLAALTGVPFGVVDETEDGSPSHERVLLHIAVQGDAPQGLSQVLRPLLNNSDSGSFIAFADSRQGVERIAAQLGHNGVKPYRSGYEAEDRQAIERALREARLRGVVSTSALELGVNISHFVVGLNVDVPTSRKAFRQRVGRVGRSQPGAFAVIADTDAFHRLGSTFRDYWDGSVEPSHLYLSNRFMQFAHARCLASEVEALTGTQPHVPTGANWPEGFAEVFEYVKPSGARPREFDYVREIGGDEPHYNYPLRNMAEASFQITRGGDLGGGRLGTVNLQQAIREVYPGAIYLHMAQGYKVYEWRNSAFDRTIRVGPWRGIANTKPLIRTFVNAAVDQSGIVNGNYCAGTQGFLAECQLQITERVEGVRVGKTNALYRDLRKDDPRMTPKTRDFRTTGVIMRVDADWFRAAGEKVRLANALQDLVAREYSVSPQDFAVVATNISLVRNGSREAVSDALVVYDATYGSLRLTEPVYTNLPRLLDRLERAVELVGSEGAPPVSLETVSGLRGWFLALEEKAGPAADGGILPDGWLRVLGSGSRVTRRDSRGVLHDIEIIEPELIDAGEGLRLFYRYRPVERTNGATPVTRVADSLVERGGDEWTEVLWCPTTGETTSSAEDAALPEG